MHNVARFCLADARAPAIRPAGSVQGHSLYNAFRVDLPPSPARRGARFRGSWDRSQQAECYGSEQCPLRETRRQLHADAGIVLDRAAPILIGRSRSVANSQVLRKCGAHAMNQPGPRGVDNKPHLIVGRAMTRHAIRSQLCRVQIDQVLHLPALAVDVLVKVLRRASERGPRSRCRPPGACRSCVRPAAANTQGEPPLCATLYMNSQRCAALPRYSSHDSRRPPPPRCRVRHCRGGRRCRYRPPTPSPRRVRSGCRRGRRFGFRPMSPHALRHVLDDGPHLGALRGARRRRIVTTGVPLAA
jgi:hypothetical protein